MRRCLALVALAAFAQCTNVARCKDGTLLVTLTLAGDAAQTDQLRIAVAVDGGTPFSTSVSHVLGQATGTIEVDFPSGYPQGHSVTVDVTAATASGVVGENSASAALSSGCATLPLTVMATGASSPGDMAATRDLAVGDMPPPDLRMSGDLASVDDMAMSPDLSMPPAPDLATPCGMLGQACCSGNTCTQLNLACQSGVCQSTCGQPGQQCCSAGYCQPSASQACCVNNTCVAIGGTCSIGGSCMQEGSCGGCGAFNQPCCGGTTCTAAFTYCASGTCKGCGVVNNMCCPGGVCESGTTCIASSNTCQ